MPKVPSISGVEGSGENGGVASKSVTPASSDGSPGMLEIARRDKLLTVMDSTQGVPPPRGCSAPHHGGEGLLQGGGAQIAKPIVYTPLVLPLSPQYAPARHHTTSFIGSV